MLKKALAVTAAAGALAFLAPVASADVCVDVYLEVNGSPVADQSQCVETE